MSLQLKHLSPYLPYSLILQNRAFPHQLIILEGLDFEKNYIISTSKDIYGEKRKNTYCNEGAIKPILRPLSDLTKIITINKNSFIPSEEYSFISEYLTELSNLNHTYVKHIQYKCFEILVELHFDVFGLIEKGLAININSLN